MVFAIRPRTCSGRPELDAAGGRSQRANSQGESQGESQANRGILIADLDQSVATVEVTKRIDVDAV